VARVDDLIIMANGEKAIPTPLESALLSHPSVHGAIAFGRSRDQIGILVEPVQSALADVNHETLSAFRDLIWFVHLAMWRTYIDLFIGQLWKLEIGRSPHMRRCIKRCCSSSHPKSLCHAQRRVRSAELQLFLLTKLRSHHCGFNSSLIRALTERMLDTTW
jgi:hypothetical protein